MVFLSKLSNHFYLFIYFLQLNFLVTENRQKEIVDPQCEGVQSESLDALISVAFQCVSSNPEDRPTMHRVVQLLESEVMTPCPSDFYDSNSDWESIETGVSRIASLFQLLYRSRANIQRGSGYAKGSNIHSIRSFFPPIYDIRRWPHHSSPFDH